MDSLSLDLLIISAPDCTLTVCYLDLYWYIVINHTLKCLSGLLD